MGKTTTTNAGIHVRYWSGGPTWNLTDMANAGKRGKKCRTLRLAVWGAEPAREYANRLRDALAALFGRHEDRPYEDTDLIVTTRDWDTVASVIRDEVELLRRAGAPAHAINLEEKEIRGVDAPRPILTAGKDGVWAASASIESVSASDYTDKNNEPRACSRSEQSKAAAYNAAAKVWAKVQAAETFHAACRVLSEGGVNLHTWCGRD